MSPNLLQIILQKYMIKNPKGLYIMFLTGPDFESKNVCEKVEAGVSKILFPNNNCLCLIKIHCVYLNSAICVYHACKFFPFTRNSDLFL